MASRINERDQEVPTFSFPVFCKCRKSDGSSFLAVERTSWKPSNPGRRFLNCRNSYNFQVGVQKCDLFVWKDKDISMYWKQLISSLKDEIEFLRSTLACFVPVSVIEGLEDENATLNVEKEMLIKEKRELLKRIEELEGELAILAANGEQEKSKFLDEIAEMKASLGGLASEAEKKVVFWQVFCACLIIAIVAMLAGKVFRS